MAVAVTTRLFHYAADDLAFSEDREVVAEEQLSWQRKVERARLLETLEGGDNDNGEGEEDDERAKPEEGGSDQPFAPAFGPVLHGHASTSVALR